MMDIVQYESIVQLGINFGHYFCHLLAHNALLIVA